MKISVAGIITIALICNVSISRAREMGHYAPGVVSIRDLAVPPVPGFFYAQYNAYYSADRYVDGDGNKRLNFESEGGEVKLDTDVDVLAIAPVFLWSTEKKFWVRTTPFMWRLTLAKAQCQRSCRCWIKRAAPTIMPLAWATSSSSPFGWDGKVSAMMLP